MLLCVLSNDSLPPNLNGNLLPDMRQGDGVPNEIIVMLIYLGVYLGAYRVCMQGATWSEHHSY